MIRIYTDAGTFKNRICVYDERTKKHIIDKIYGDKLTNNHLEYKALQKALKYVRDEYKDEKVQIFTDSKLVVNQVGLRVPTNSEVTASVALRTRTSGAQRSAVWPLCQRSWAHTVGRMSRQPAPYSACVTKPVFPSSRGPHGCARISNVR